MGDIKKAYDFLNKTLKLGLSANMVAGAELAFKLDLAKVEGFKAEMLKDQKKLSQDWEVKTILVPRKAKIAANTLRTLTELQNLTKKEMQK